jgi:hypothetical protein
VVFGRKVSADGADEGEPEDRQNGHRLVDASLSVRGDPGLNRTARTQKRSISAFAMDHEPGRLEDND